MQFSSRDLALLQLLSRTPVTAAMILKASVTFNGYPFGSERRVRERIQALSKAKLVSRFPLALTGGGLASYYKLTAEGYRVVRGPEAELPHKSFFGALAPSRLMHCLELAETIVHSLVAAHAQRMKLSNFHRENELVLEIGHHRTSPDCHMQFTTSGKTFNVLFEIDRSTESLDSAAVNSIRNKILAYEAYQDWAWQGWKQAGERGPRPYFRVAFLTATVERAYHILALARYCARNKDRRLCYTATLDSFLAEAAALSVPLFLDHHGEWQAIVNIHSSAPIARPPVRLSPFLQPALPI
jgi:hypothetical protein